tara:strand:+ start:1740 stop:2069 length:330 start_codon:yes stop_codon:yes gene_type:complete
MTAQLDIFTLRPARQKLTIKERFWEFHQANPHVYRALVDLARQLARQGHRRLGMKMLFEVLRWQSMIKTFNPDGSDFKLSNDYTAYYARLIMSREHDLKGIFKTKELSQ